MTGLPVVVWALEPGPARRQVGVIAELDEAGVDAVLLPDVALAAPDSIMLAAAGSRRAPRIGLVATFSPWIQPPYLTARALGTLDSLTRGRAGWLVTPGPAMFAATDDTLRWSSAGVTDERELDAALEDYLAAMIALYNSWEPDALIADLDRGQYVDPSKVHVTNYRGPFFETRGPLNMPRPPQGRPVLFARHAVRGEVSAAESTAADVSIVAHESEVGAASGLSETVLLEIEGAAAATPPATAADGYVFSGVAEPELHGHLLHAVVPALVPERRSRGLLRERLRLSPEAFTWSGTRGPTDGSTG